MLNGEIVLVFAKPGYHASSAYAATTFDDARIRRSFHAGKFVALIVEYDDWEGTTIRSLFREFGHTKHPFVVIYSSDREPARLEKHRFNSC